MIISPSHKFMFIHIPKAAGTSVRMFFVDNPAVVVDKSDRLTGSRHETMVEFYERLGRDAKSYKGYYKFCFVRNPWDRIVSAYHYLQINMSNLKEKFSSFEEFIDLIADENSLTNQYRTMRPQVDFFLDKDGQRLVNLVGRYETMEDDLKKIGKRLNLDIDLDRINVSQRGHYRDYYNDDTAAIISQRFARDIDYLGYTFDDD